MPIIAIKYFIKIKILNFSEADGVLFHNIFQLIFENT